MKITVDTKNKVISWNGQINLSELMEFMNNSDMEIQDWKLGEEQAIFNREKSIKKMKGLVENQEGYVLNTSYGG